MTNLDYNVQKSEARHHDECLDSHLSVIHLAKNCKSITLVYLGTMHEWTRS